MQINLAIVTEGIGVKQETFLMAHKELLPFNKFFYYGGAFSLKLENKGPLIDTSFKKGTRRALGALLNKDFYDIEYSFKMSLRKNKVDVVMFEFGTSAPLLSKYVEQLGIPYIVNFYGYDASIRSFIDEHKSEYLRIFRNAYRVTAVSDDLKQRLLQLGCEESKILVSRCGPNQDFIKLEPSFSNNTFFALGRFIDKKSPIETLLAFKLVKDHEQSAMLYIGGDGPLLEASERLVHGLNLQDSVTFLGRIERQEYLGFMENALAFIQHSVEAKNGDAEGTPVVLLEAGLSAIPVISTIHGGISEVVVHGETGYLVKEHDIEGMAAYMLELIQNKSKAKELGLRARDHINDNYSIGKRILDLKSLITSAVSQ